MRLNRARYVTICQQFLVTAVTAAVGLSAAGVMTLQIVSPDGQEPARALGGSDLAPAVSVGDAYVDTTVVTPKVREVAVAPVARTSAQRTHEKRVVLTAGGVKRAREIAAVSKPTKVHGFATVGVTWKSGTRLAENQIAVQVRTLQHGTWSGWTTAAYHDEHGPDPGSAEAAKVRPGTDAVVVGNVDEVQMRAATNNGIAPADIKLAVIDPGQAQVRQAAPAIDTAKIPASDQHATSAPPIESTAGMSGGNQTMTSDPGAGADAALMAMKVAPKPLIYSRAQWGANEALRDPSSLHYGTIETGFIHHTVNANNYTPQQVPALIRGIYAYHTQSRGWSDIGYNFLVDRFGRIWEGRYGGVDRPVVGAHTLGYNQYSFAMSAIGNFQIAQPPQVMLDAYARLFAWKLSLSNIRADATHLWVKDKYFHAINGHRDAGQTECPGQYLYAKIPSIRVAAQAIQNTGIVPGPPTPPVTPTDPAQMVPLAAPAGVPLPTATPVAAVPQPAMKFPVRSNIVGSPWPDLAMKSASGAITLISTGGMVGYSAPVYNAGPWRWMSLVTAVGDVTGNGKPDVLAKTARTGYARVFRSDGLGHVSSKGYGGTYAFKYANMIVAAGDLDRDGHNDVLARDRRTGALMLFRGLGRGRFAAPTVLRRSWPFGATAAGDLNGDGKVDLLAVRSDNALVFLAGKGGTTPATSFAAPVVVARLSGTPSSIAVGADATGDGRPDVAVTMPTGLTTLYAGNGSGGLGLAFGPFIAAAGLSQLTGASMLGTSAFDLIGKAGGSRLAVLAENGMRNIGRHVPTNLIIPGASQVLDVGDWDHNGTADLITREIDNNRLVLRPGLGNGKYGRGRSLGNGWRTVTELASVGDVTGDGYPDLIGRIGTGPMLIFPGAGLNAFKNPMLAPASLRTFNQIGTTPWSPAGSTFVSADGTFVPLTGSDLGSALRAANGTAVTSYDSYVGVGDANGDGVADLLAREKGTGTLWLLPGKASGGFAPRVWVANGYAGYQLIG